MQRRSFIAALGGSALLASGAALGASRQSARARVVVVGGGFGGATVAKYLRLWSEAALEVTLIEANPQFVSCPHSNLVLGGSRTMADITLTYAELVRRHGVNLVQGVVSAIDADKRTVILADGTVFAYDRLVLSPGVDFMWQELPGMLVAGAQDTVLHAWKAGPQTLALRRQLEVMPDGGLYAITIPLAPYRCLPAPYERACLIASYFSRAKKKSRVLILDANDDVQSKGKLFRQAWRERYPDIIEYRPNFVCADVHAVSNTVISEFDDQVSADVLNVVPPQRAGNIAARAGLANSNQRWCEVDFLSYESTRASNIHVLGDAIQTAPQMPKSAHMANQQAKICAAAIIDLFNQRLPNRHPLAANTCYSYVSDSDAMHVASVHIYDAELATMMPAPRAGGLSAAANAQEGEYGRQWASNIWADTLR